MKTFEQVWAEKETEGYKYGVVALETLRFGWELASIEFEKRIAELEASQQKIRALVDEQAQDEALWFQHEFVTEHTLQCALRKLHAVIEGDAPPASIEEQKE